MLVMTQERIDIHTHTHKSTNCHKAPNSPQVNRYLIKLDITAQHGRPFGVIGKCPPAGATGQVL